MQASKAENKLFAKNIPKIYTDSRDTHKTTPNIKIIHSTKTSFLSYLNSEGAA